MGYSTDLTERIIKLENALEFAIDEWEGYAFHYYGENESTFKQHYQYYSKLQEIKEILNNSL
jgi:uncharacterized protein YukE